MTDEADFETLSEPLESIRPIIDEFRARHGFVYTARQSIGRYPRIRVERSRHINLWFDLWMELDEQGSRFKTFRQDLPYELSAGAYLDVADGSQYGVRFQTAFQCFVHTPFNTIGEILLDTMEKGLRVLETWDEAYLRKNGTAVPLGS